MTNNSHTEKNKRIAKNTMLLYVRTFVMMIVNLYTSRLILQILGVDDYGVQNVVGGFVSMFSVISGSLSGAISRFLTFALGEGDVEKLRKTFSFSMNIQFLLSIAILLLGEIIGVWFVNYKLNIPQDRVFAAHWVYQCALGGFIMGLISVPYNACIIARERMGVFAYMTILDAVLKLLVAFTLFVVPYDKLVTFAVLGLLVSVLMRLIYACYCNRNFEECHYEFCCFDKNLFKEMTSFAWWGFFGNTAWMFNTQGVNILVNMFFGVALNAARGVAGQVEGAVMGFVGNFSTAMNPQITKSYAAGDKDYLFSIICNGAKYQFFLMLLFMIPLEVEAPKVLSIWLTEVPSHAVLFLRLSMLCTLATLYGNTSYTAIMATGRIKSYQICVTIIGCMVFPLTWISYKLGFSVQTTYYIFFLIYGILVFVRVIYLKKLMDFPPILFWKRAILPSLFIGCTAPVLPLTVSYLMPESFLRVVTVVFISALSTTMAFWIIGMDAEQHGLVIKYMKKRFPIG